MNELTAQEQARKEEWVEGMTHFVGKLQSAPNVRSPYCAIYYAVGEVADFQDLVKMLGAGEKGIDDQGYMSFRSELRGLSVTAILVNSDVCEMVDTGEVEEYTEVETVTAAVVKEVTKTRPVLKRVCPESILAIPTGEDVNV
jgi:hypothetical protein